MAELLQVDQSRWFPTVPWLRPAKISAVEENGVLYLMADGKSSSWSLVTGEPAVMAGFIKLADAGLPRFAAFAKRFGMLMHCGHGKYWLGCTRNRSDRTDEFSFCLPTFHEPVDEWRTQARRIRAILTCSARIWRDENPDETDLADAARIRVEQLRGFMYDLYEQADETRNGLSGPKRWQPLVEHAVNRLLQEAMVVPKFRWAPDSCQIDFGGGGLLCALATQVALAVARVGRLVLCDNCGQPIVGRKRQPAAGQRAWCERPKCKLARGAAAARDCRHRKRDH